MPKAASVAWPISSPRGFFSKLTPAARQSLLSLGGTSRYERGDALVREGEHSDHVALLLKGRVKITSVAPNGYEAVLGIRGPGDLVGEMALLGGHPRSATVIALDRVAALTIAGSDFRRVINTEPGVGVKVAELIADRLRAANRSRLEFGAYTVRKRLAIVLLDLDRWYGTGAPDGKGPSDIDLALSQADLAGLVGASVEAVRKAIRGHAHQEIIATRRQHITILDRSALADLTRYD